MKSTWLRKLFDKKNFPDKLCPGSGFALKCPVFYIYLNMTHRSIQNFNFLLHFMISVFITLANTIYIRGTLGIDRQNVPWFTNRKTYSKMFHWSKVALIWQIYEKFVTQKLGKNSCKFSRSALKNHTETLMKHNECAQKFLTFEINLPKLSFVFNNSCFRSTMEEPFGNCN